MENYCRIKMMLYHKFKEVNSLNLDFEEASEGMEVGRYESWEAAYKQCHIQHYHYVGVKVGLDTLAVAVDDSEFEGELDEEEGDFLWQELAAQRPRHDNVNLEDPDALSRRDVDRAFDWAPYINKYPGLSYN